MLIAACRSNNVDMLEEVVHQQEGDGVSFINNARDSLGNDCVHVCTKYGSLECLDWLLDISGVNLNNRCRMTGDTPLHFAVMFIKKDQETALRMVEMLMEVGADPLLTNNDGFRPIDLVPGDFHDVFASALEGPAPALQYSADVVADDDDEEEGSGESDEE